MQADFENYRKRTEKEMREIEENSSKGLVLRLLSVLDELDLAVKHASDDAGRTELQEGIEMVRKNMYSVLESAGLRRIDSVGKPFDPSSTRRSRKSRAPRRARISWWKSCGPATLSGGM